MTIAVALPLSRFYDREARHPDKRYLIQPLAQGRVQSLSWFEVGDQARRAAHWLRRRKLPAGSSIAIISNNCAHWIIADLAIWMSGHVSVPLSPYLSADAVAQVLEHCGAALVFVGKLDDWPTVSAGVKAGVPTVALPISPPDAQFDFTWADLQAWSPIRDNPYGQPNQLATIIYTASTPDMPRGVMHSFATLGFAATHASSLFGLGEKDRLFSCLPLCHIAERMFVELASFYGGQTIFFAQNPQTFIADLKRARPTALFAVPRVWTRLQTEVLSRTPALRLDHLLSLPLIGLYMRRKVLKALGLEALKVALRGAAPVPEVLLDWYRRLGVNVRQVYGMTEGCGYSHLCPPGPSKSGWVGQPCPQVRVRIADNGEVQVRSGAVMPGYFKDPLRTAEVLTADGYLRTGDRGEQDAEGNLRLTGRLKEFMTDQHPPVCRAIGQ